MLLPGSHVEGAGHVQKVEACVELAPGPHGVQTRFGYTRPLLKLPAGQKHSGDERAPANE